MSPVVVITVVTLSLSLNPSNVSYVPNKVCLFQCVFFNVWEFQIHCTFKATKKIQQSSYPTENSCRILLKLTILIELPFILFSLATSFPPLLFSGVERLGIGSIRVPLHSPYITNKDTSLPTATAIDCNASISIHRYRRNVAAGLRDGRASW